MKAGTEQVESGAKKIGDGQIGEGVKETAKGIGSTVAEGAKYTGEKIKERVRPPSRRPDTPGRARETAPCRSARA